MPAASPSIPRDDVEIVTLGCRLNSSESEQMRAHAIAAGLTDAIIVNTCAVTSEAVRQSRQAIRKLRRARPGARIIVTGCAAQLETDAFAAMPEIDRLLGNGEKLGPDAFATGARVVVGDIMSAKTWAARPVRRTAARARADVEIQSGCDHRCTFCIIPFARGNARSAPAGAVVEQIRALVGAGVREVVLTGVDITSWGHDLPGAPALGNLVARILRLVPDLERLRLSSLDAVEMDETLFHLVTSEPRIAPHLHLSLQHGADLILKHMKRRHSREQAVSLCARLKAARPEIALGADLIAGFPTETQAHHGANIALIEDCQLTYAHIFPFSPRTGTPAARMPQIERAQIKARAADLRAAAGAALTRHLDGWIGRSADALIEHEGAARLADFTVARIEGPAAPGESIAMRFSGHDGAALRGERL